MLGREACMFDDVCSTFFVGRILKFRSNIFSIQHTTNVEACSRPFNNVVLQRLK